MARINSVTIKRFKKLQDVTIPLDYDVTVLVGANNSGKSSVLQAMHFGVAVAQSSSLLEGVFWLGNRFEVSVGPNQLLYAPAADILALANGGKLIQDILQRIEIRFNMSDGKSCTVGIKRGKNRNVSIALEGRELGLELQDVAHPFSAYVPGLAGIAKEEGYIPPGRLKRMIARGDANLVLRNILYAIYQNHAIRDTFLQDMRAIFPGFDFLIQYNPEVDESIEVHVTSGSSWLPIDTAGTSVLQTCQILGYINLFKPRLLILDEPDSHIHPNNQRKLCQLVFRLADERGFQAVISTHSRHVLDALRQEANLLWMDQGAVVSGADFNSTAVLLDLGALDSIDYFADGEMKCLVVSEDTATGHLRRVLESAGFVDEETEVMSYSGCTKVDSAIVLGRFLKEKAPNVRLVVHRDSDYLSSETLEKMRTELKNHGIAFFATKYSDVEGYFANSDHLAALNSDVSREDVVSILNKAIEETKDDAISDIVNQRTQEGFIQQKKSGVGPNFGKIAIEATAEYDENPAAMQRGKRTLRRLNHLWQEKFGKTPQVMGASPHLIDETLRNLAHQLWPSENGSERPQSAAIDVSQVSGGKK